MFQPLGEPPVIPPLWRNVSGLLAHEEQVRQDPQASRRRKAYNGAMRMQVDAIYENGILKPLQPLDLAENEHVLVTVDRATPALDSPQLDIAYVESLQKEMREFEPAPGLDEVRRRLSKIPGSMTADFITEREER